MKEGNTWKTLAKIRNGHKFFREALPDEGKTKEKDRRIAIADDSGRYPENTTDGILWVDRTKPIRFVGGYFIVQLLDNNDTVTSTTVGVDEAVYLIKDIGMKLQLVGFDSDAILREVKRI